MDSTPPKKQLRSKAQKQLLDYKALRHNDSSLDSCLLPFINQKYFENLWTIPYIIVNLEFDQNFNITFPTENPKRSITQDHLNLNLIISILKFAQPPIVHVKISSMSRLTFQQLKELAFFLKRTEAIKEIYLTLPSVVLPMNQMFLDLIFPKITQFVGPAQYASSFNNKLELQKAHITSCVCLYTSQTSQRLPPLLSVFGLKTKTLVIDGGGLFEDLWTQSPVPFSSYVENICFVDYKLFNYQYDLNAKPEIFEPKTLVDFNKSCKVLSTAVSDTCNVELKCYLRCRYMPFHSARFITNELSAQIKKAKQLIEIANTNDLKIFKVSLELDVILKCVSNTDYQIDRPAMVLQAFHDQLGIEIYSHCANRGSRDPRDPQCFKGKFEDGDLTLSMGFTYGCYCP